MNTKSNLSLLALAAGGVALYMNRFRIQRFLESQGVSTPWMTGSFGEAMNSGAAKISGAAEGVVRNDRIDQV